MIQKFSSILKKADLNLQLAVAVISNIQSAFHYVFMCPPQIKQNKKKNHLGHPLQKILAPPLSYSSSNMYFPHLVLLLLPSLHYSSTFQTFSSSKGQEGTVCLQLERFETFCDIDMWWNFYKLCHLIWDLAHLEQRGKIVLSKSKYRSVFESRRERNAAVDLQLRALRMDGWWQFTASSANTSV